MTTNHVKNPYLKIRIGDDNLSKYSSTHLERLRTNIPQTTDMIFGIPVSTLFNTMITETETVFNDWKTSTEIKATEKAQKEGKTISVNQSFEDMKSFISVKEGVIADKFPKGSPVYEEFFPLGLSEYSRLNKKNANNIFKRFISTLEIHKDVFAPEMFTEATEKYNTLISLRQAQLQKIGKVIDEISVAGSKRYALEVQLYKNLLTLLLINAEHPEKAEIYFDESILKKKNKKENASEQKTIEGK